jgi:hypothetical protein
MVPVVGSLPPFAWGAVVALATTQENAHLIASAPDLAEALEAICLQFPEDDVLRECAALKNSDDDGKPVHRHWAQKILAARAALSKARGQT